MRIVTGRAGTSTGRDMHERGIPGCVNLLSVAFSTELIQGETGAKRFVRAWLGMAQGAIPPLERSMEGCTQEALALRGMGVVTLLAIRLNNRILPVSALEGGIVIVA